MTAPFSQSRTKGFTVMELVVASAITSMMLAAILVSFLAMQRASTFCLVWGEARSNQVRLIESLALDLRDATTMTFATSGNTSVLPLTLTIPKRYSAYVTSGPQAGDPDPSATRINPTINSTTGALTLNENVTVVYAETSSSSGSKTITRQLTSAQGSATRSISTFPNSAVISFQNQSGSLIGSKDRAVVITVAATSTGNLLNNRQSVITTFTDTVYLRSRK